jgi:hypothetical protein
MTGYNCRKCTTAARVAAGVVLLMQTIAAYPGSADPARQFDFWIGTWKIEQKILRKDGSWLTLHATTSVSPAIDSNALVEHWEGDVEFFWEGMSGPEHMTGLSVRSFDAHTAKWQIYWMDSRHPQFGAPYVGAFASGKGEFTREWETAQGKRRGRITFSDITNDSVHWDLAVSSDTGMTWKTLWIMEMKKANGE